MPSCIVEGCTYSWKKKDPDIIIHTFPRDLESIKRWLLQTKQDFGDIEEFSRKILEGTKGAYRVCSQHFTSDSYETRGFMTWLKKGAIPTIFPDIAARHKSAKETTKRRKINPTFINYGSVPGVGYGPAAAVWHLTSVAALSAHNFIPPIAGGERDVQDMCTLTAGGRLDFHHRSPSLYSEHRSVRGHNIPGERKTKPYGPRPTGRTGLYSGPIHQATNTEPFLGTSNKRVQADRRKRCNSVGIQCNPEDLPAIRRESQRYPLRISLRKFDVLIWADPFGKTPCAHPGALDLS
ncbi:uncharacterized protein LOC130282635 [Hyla sarda]|uniref:uncharacterized protein LOC130282635 n=1 Tax=Hyla sarda TaxID=327740 RepID=UPI0024C43417|nr:uncharacterized protein LOC130282635 [Hyla sarda]